MGAEGVDAAQVKMGFSRVTGCCSLGNKSFLLSALAFTFVILNLAALWALHFADRPVTKGSLRSATRFSTGQLGATNGATPSVGDVVSFNNDNVLRVGAGTTAYLNLMTLNADAFNIPYVNFAPMGTGSNYTNVMGYTVRQDSATTSFLTTMTFNPDNRTIVAGSISDANTFTSDAIRGLATLSDTQMAVLTVWNTSDGYTSVKTAVTPATLDASTGSVTLDKSKIANVTTGSATNFIAPISSSSFVVTYYDAWSASYDQYAKVGVMATDGTITLSSAKSFGVTNGAGLSTEFGAPVALKGLSSTGAGFAIPYYTELDSYTQDPNNPKTDSDLSGICVTTAVFSDNALSSFTTPVCGTGYRPGHYPEIVALSDSAIAVIFYDTANNNALTVVTMTLSSDKILSISGSYVFPEVHGDLSAYSPSFLSPHGRLLSGNRLAVSFLNPAMNGRLCVRVFSFSLYTLTLKELTPVLPVGPSDFAWVTTSNKWPVNHAMVPLGADGFVTGYVGRRNNVLQQTFAAFESFGNPVGIVQSTSGDSVSVTTQGNAKTSGLTDGAVYYATTSGAVVAQNGTSMDPDFFYTADGTMLVTQDSRVGVAVDDDKLFISTTL
ncbi:Serine/threonine-protein kinase AtPK2/AtPK19 [Phytophthora cinnamomi]|uniref:Serine/threonine-protein kinase AtPK2/AtPK19 n=1 Tax=Phytophthora cinnamomi TaxID=4785 RepID=UPI003559D05B|nr:Serine/threonine-protein kinase AtPK2/AtPK19 [Phytophthora cinnamomi]